MFLYNRHSTFAFSLHIASLQKKKKHNGGKHVSNIRNLQIFLFQLWTSDNAADEGEGGDGEN